MDVQEVERRVQALAPSQLAVVIAYAHGFCPEAVEQGLDLEASTRPALKAVAS